ncbi:MAG: TlpA family protein disulfide reductase [Phycisphaeraceae bacterium]|nr:TlpA family protein disulfide reductase [Phycisphaeraceae bacterium]
MPAPLPIFALSFSLAATCALAAVAPPTNEQIDRAVEAYRKQTGGEHTRDNPRVGELLKDFSIREMSAAHFERLGILLDLAPLDMRAAFHDHLTRIAHSDKTEEGAAAAAQIVRLIELPDEHAPPGAVEEFESARVGALIAAAEHPGFARAVQAGRGTIVYSYMFFYATDRRIIERGVVSKLAANVTDRWPEAHIDDLLAFAEGIIAPEARVDRATIDRVRAAATTIAQRIIARPETEEQTREGLLAAVGAINSAAAKGELVGGRAPALEFLWRSGTDRPGSLADLAGRVVVLDFWATWCGPCIASFPHLRDLRERFRGAPVEIIGVTSLQGWILDPKAKDPAARRIRGLSPEEELRRLAQWVRDMDMTWTVAVSKQPVFNAEYGVRGLPTVVIIDAAGVVRHAGLSPDDDQLAARIAALLAEIGASAPPATDSPAR